jgi:hypothetical protein
VANSPGGPALVGQSTLGALWEVAGQWLLSVMATLVLAYALLVSLEQREVETSLDGRLRTVLEQAGDRVEVSLSLGIELSAIPDGQDLVERLSASENDIALDIFDASGLFVASTDRASVGRPVPPEWVAAARAGERTIRVGARRVIFVPLEGSFGDNVGYIAAGYSPPKVAASGYWRLLLVAGAVFGALFLYAYYEVRRMRRPLHAVASAMAGEGGADLLPGGVSQGLSHLLRTEKAVADASERLAADQR